MMFEALPSAVTDIFSTLKAKRFRAYLVGGCVRDTLLGLEPHDYDIATDAEPNEIIAAFSDFSVVATGLKHGTVTVIMDGQTYEITTFRTDGTYTDNRHPDSVSFTKDIAQDAARRDFTVNAMAWNPEAGLVDFYGGRDDLANRCIRCVGDADTRFREDALRILRALRFSAVYGFFIEDSTAAAVRNNKSLLSGISHERVYSELCKLIVGENAKSVLLAYSDILAVILPEIVPMIGFEQHNFHHVYDVWTHSVMACAAIPGHDAALKLAALLHDCGKPETFSMDENDIGHFYGHAQVSADTAHSILHRLRADNATIKRVCNIIRHHDTPTEPDEQMLTKRLSRWGERLLRDVLIIQRADNLAMAPAFRYRQEQLDGTERLIDEIVQKSPCLTIRDLAVNGIELMNIGLTGKEIGEAQRFLLAAVLDGKIENERSALLAYLDITK